MLRIVAAALVIAFWTASSIPIVDDPTNSTSLYTCSLIRFLLSATDRQARDQGHARFDRRSSDERWRDGGSIVHPLAQSGESVGSDHGLRAGSTNRRLFRATRGSRIGRHQPLEARIVNRLQGACRFVGGLDG